MSLLTKESLLTKPILETEDVVLPEFGGVVRVRQWLGEDKDDWQIYVSALKGDAHKLRAAAVAASLVGDDGNRVFNMNGDVDSINATWPASAIERVWEVVARLNKIGQKEVEDAEKN